MPDGASRPVRVCRRAICERILKPKRRDAEKARCACHEVKIVGLIARWTSRSRSPRRRSVSRACLGSPRASRFASRATAAQPDLPAPPPARRHGAKGASPRYGPPSPPEPLLLAERIVSPPSAAVQHVDQRRCSGAEARLSAAFDGKLHPSCRLAHLGCGYPSDPTDFCGRHWLRRRWSARNRDVSAEALAGRRQRDPGVLIGGHSRAGRRGMRRSGGEFVAVLGPLASRS